MEETHDIRLKRLRLRSWRRGTKEMDLILGGFADTELARLGPEALDAHEALMEEPDAAIHAWITGVEPVPERHRAALERILAHLAAKSLQLRGKNGAV